MMRLFPFFGLIIGSALALSFSAPMWLSLILVALSLLGLWDLSQKKHSLRRNYPITGWLRPLLEEIRPQIRQYFIESDTEGRPFDREQRDLVYQRAKGVVDSMPFGSERNTQAPGFEWVNHSMTPRPPDAAETRIMIGGETCSQPYSSSLLNISAMSFGALSAAAIRALNLGAKIGGFAHDSGEGGLSFHHRAGGDIIWEIGTGYFGCRDAQGRFNAQAFQRSAVLPQVRMIEIKLSQGAKPGHGGILPAAKVTREIARARGVPVGEDCISPPYHSAFSTPRELLQFVALLRELSEGKPIGIKLCIGHRWEFLALCKAMRQLEVYPDFIVVDGKEGGTGAAPVEFADHVGTPLRDALLFVHNALVGAELRDKIRIGASGKVVSGFDMALCLALGADWCNAARGFMLALGCLQSQKCHTNRCPVGIATQDPWRQRALVAADKSQRVANFHRHTVQALSDLAAAAGVSTPGQLTMEHFYHRTTHREAVPLWQSYQFLSPGELLHDIQHNDWRRWWQLATAESFAPSGPIRGQ